MKRVILSLSILITLSLSLLGQEGVNWLSLAEVEKLCKENPKPIYIDVYTTWCGSCKIMERETFSNEEVISTLNEKFYAVKFDGESDEVFNFLGKKYASPGRYHQVLDLFRVQAFPTSVFYSTDLQMVISESGYVKTKPFLRILEYISSEKYK